MKTTITEIVFSQLRKVELRRSVTEIGRNAYSIVVETDRSIVSAGTELAMLAGRWFQSGATFPFVPNAMIVGKVIWIGAAAGQVRPDLGIGSCVLVKASHSSLVEKSVLTDLILTLEDGVPADIALLARQALIARSAVRLGRMENSQRSLVVGLGLIGQLIVRYAASEGAQVIGIDRHLNRREIASRVLSFGVAESETSLDVGACFVACADPAAIRQAVENTADGGSVVLAAGPPGETSLDIGLHVFRRNLRIVGAHERFFASTLKTEWQSISKDLMSGSMDVSGLITTSIPLRDVEALYNERLCCKDDYVGMVIDWS